MGYVSEFFTGTFVSSGYSAVLVAISHAVLSGTVRLYKGEMHQIS